MVGSPSGGRVGNQRSASRTAPSGILAARSRSNETSVVWAGASFNSLAAVRVKTVMRVPPCVPPARRAQAECRSPKTIES